MSRDYFNRQAHQWDLTVAERDKAKLEKLAARLGIASCSAVLDVGTGTGVLIPYLSKAVGDGGRVVAIDFAEAMIKKARAKEFGGNIEFICSDALKLPLDKDRFDMVVCYSSFPHFRDKPTVLKELYRVTKPGGRLAICHTSSRSQVNLIHSQIPALAGDLLPAEAELRLILTAAGFRDIEIEDGDESYLCLAARASK